MIIKNAQKSHRTSVLCKKVQSSVVSYKPALNHVSYALRRPRIQGYRKISDMPVEYLADMIKNREEVQ